MHHAPLSARYWHWDKLLALGYYDGPTEGLCQRGNRAYVFKMVATDVDRDLRVIALSEIGADEFARIIVALEPELGPPHWPLWVPRWEFSSEVAQKAAEDAVNHAYRAGTIMAVALCDDTLTHCNALRAVDESQTAGVTDWFAFVQAGCL